MTTEQNAYHNYVEALTAYEDITARADTLRINNATPDEWEVYKEALNAENELVKETRRQYVQALKMRMAERLARRLAAHIEAGIRMGRIGL